MTVFYVDPIGGNNSNDGLSFANRKKQCTMSGSSMSSGDEIRFMKTADPKSLGNGTWTADAGLVAGTGAFNGTGQHGLFVKGNPTTINFSNAHNLTTGDIVQVNNSTLHESYTQHGLSGLFKCTVIDSDTITIPYNSTGQGWSDDTSAYVSYKFEGAMVKLATTDIVKPVAHCPDSGYYSRWVTSTNISHTTSSQPYLSMGLSNFAESNLDVRAEFTSGKVAYTPLPSTVDISAYEQISFYFGSQNYSSGANSSYGPMPDGLYELRLCSDNSGDTAVHTIPIRGSGGRDCRFQLTETKDFGTALSNNINSVAIYATAEIEDQHYIACHHIIACKDSSATDAITLDSVISKSNSATSAGEWYGVSGIFFGQYIALANKEIYGAGFDHTDVGYTGTSETVTTYWRHCPCLASDQVTQEFYGKGIKFTSTSSTTGTPDGITVSGGWDTTNMSTRNGMSFYKGSGYDHQLFFYQHYAGYAKLKNFGLFMWYHMAQQYDGAKTEIDNCWGYLSMYGFLDLNGRGANTITNSWFMYDQNQWQDDMGGTGTKINDCHFINASWIGKDSGGNTFTDCFIRSPGSHVSNSYLGGSNTYNNCTFDDVYKWILAANTQTGSEQANFNDCTFTRIGTNHFVQSSDSADKLNVNRKITFTNYNDDTSDHRTYWNMASMFSETSVRHTASGLAWKISPTSSNWTATKPLEITIGEIFCNASAAVTATLWVRRTSTLLTAKFAVLAADNTSVSSDATDTAAGSADAWEQLSISFTPTKAGPVTLKVLVYGGSTHSAYIDDFAISQA